MNFFEAQDHARRSTGLLILLLLLAVAGLLALSNFIVFEFLYFIEYETLTFSLSELSLVFDSDLSILLCAAILLFIILGSLYKLVQLSSGGSAIAQDPKTCLNREMPMAVLASGKLNFDMVLPDSEMAMVINSLTA